MWHKLSYVCSCVAFKSIDQGEKWADRELHFVIKSVGRTGSVIKTTAGHQRAAVLSLLLISLSVWTVSSTNWIISSEFKPLLPLPLQSFSLSSLLFTSISVSLSVSFSLSISLLSFSLLPVPGPQTAWLNTQANVSLFKETQVVDVLAIGQDQNEELL